MTKTDRSRAQVVAPRWTIQDSAIAYSVDGWSQGYFGINKKGHVVVRPDCRPGRSIDLYDVVEGLGERGIGTPVLLRFHDILGSRLRVLHDAFAAAIEEHDFRGTYACVYPIKVNQQRHVVENIHAFGAGFGFGFEAGSKPELLAVLGLTSGLNSVPIVCNGFKDSEFIETVVLAAKLGRKIIPIVEKYSELELLVHHAERYDVRPAIGVRVKLSARATGRWEDSSGLRSKFGLYVSEILDALEYLKKKDMADCLQLLHCHLGSQVSDIRNVKNAITEMTHIYIGLQKLGAGMKYIDIGGGLGVDYDGSKSAQESSMNYTLDEYAADVVYRIAEACDDAGIEHPTILSESGRAVTAFHSVLVFDVLGSTSFDAFEVPDTVAKAAGDRDPQELPQPVWDLYEARAAVEAGRLEEALHDAAQAHEEAMNLFRLGYMSLQDRSLAERLYWAICTRLLAASRNLEERPEVFDALEAQMSDIYFGNFSIFQSMPDSWAIDQVFPVMPIHRLREEPTRRAILADITCDSEGKINLFPGPNETKRALDLHPLRPGEPYYLAAFLVGAYQEILGDLHNLFGDTHAVHIGFDQDGDWIIQEVVPGDTVREVLSYVQFEPEKLVDSLRRDIEQAVRRKVLTVREGRQLLRFYQHGLDGYTYLEEG